MPVAPDPYFHQIRFDGKVFIGFTSEIQVLPNLQIINNGTIAEENATRRLSTTNNRKKIPVLEV